MCFSCSVITWTCVQICNEGVKLMLKDSSTRELEEYKDRVSNLGFVQDDRACTGGGDRELTGKQLLAVDAPC